MSIYVETLIQAPMADLWEKTQYPQLHQHWDARFSSITYEPRANESQRQKFQYLTRIGCGLVIAGEGERIGQREGSDRCTSSLRFWSDDPKSLILEGAGYWQYVATDAGIRFITAYDYKIRFGSIGRAFDRLAFRPFLGWATAWSFDRLRLWLERGIDPALSLQRTVIHAICRVAVAFVWVYHGLVPKLIARDPDELRLLRETGIGEMTLPAALTSIGIVEICLGVCVLLFFRSRWPLAITAVLMLLATIAIAFNSPRYLSAAFNPVSLNFLLAVVSLIGLVMMDDLPSALRCLRQKPRND